MSKLQNLLKGIIKENPVLVLVLGTCPTIAKSTNIASQKTIMKNGGILQNVVDCEDYKLNRYYIYL